jgi:cyclophilin family peptidyl-prolyl cis-trans isomerase
VHSFLSLAEQGYFDATSCHRLTTQRILVLQCGDPTGTGSGGPGYTFADETRGGESYVRGVVAMANAGPNTNGSQFFLVWGDSTSLDQMPNYTVFGRMDDASVGVVERIAADGVSGGASDGKPVNAAQIVKVTRG